MKHTICYVSKAVEGLGDEAIGEIFEVTKRNNNRDGISGVLLYGFGNFFQVLEGNRKQVERLFETIRNDSRHHKIETLINHTVKKPIFGNYSASFNIVKTRKQLRDISNYLNVSNYNKVFSDRMKRLIHPFLLSL